MCTWSLLTFASDGILMTPQGFFEIGGGLVVVEIWGGPWVIWALAWF